MQLQDSDGAVQKKAYKVLASICEVIFFNMSFPNMCVHVCSASLITLLTCSLLVYFNSVTLFWVRGDSKQVWQDNYCVIELILCP